MCVCVCLREIDINKGIWMLRQRIGLVNHFLAFKVYLANTCSISYLEVMVAVQSSPVGKIMPVPIHTLSSVFFNFDGRSLCQTAAAELVKSR